MKVVLVLGALTGGWIVKKNDQYGRQRHFFQQAYDSGQTGWPKTGASGIVDAAGTMGFFRKGARFLEIGCGQGRNLLPPLFSECHTVGIDSVLSPLLEIRGNPVFSEASLVNGDLFNLPFRRGSFDVVLDFGVLHHMRAPERRIYPKWIDEMLSPSGVFLLGVFSERFQHYPGEKRSRNWVSHRGHYDVFFNQDDFSRIMGEKWQLLHASEETAGGEIHHYRLGIFGRADWVRGKGF
jgi:SAM-dependent methyltransferase